jgi:glycine/D-amino acid oxidase-like deaminating enzyme
MIVGLGLAGAALAWALILRNKRVLVIDAEEPGAASRIAAGLMSPVSGPKLVDTWNWHTAWPVAEPFYRRIEAETGTRFLHPAPGVHLFRSAQAAQQARRRHLTAGQETGWCRELEQPLPLDGYFATHGALEVPVATRLNTQAYLDATRQMLRQRQGYLCARINLREELQLLDQGAALPRRGIEAGQIIFCGGYADHDNPWCSQIRFNPAKGEILTLKMPQKPDQRVIHRQMWIAPVDAGQVRVGSTFEWQRLDSVPTPEAREQLLQKLREFVRYDFEVIGQQAAVRPTMHDYRPVAGRHPDHPQVAVLNGLGTKGALLSPWLAEGLADDLITGQISLPAELHVNRWLPSPR